MWQESALALEIFYLCQTQWRHGFNGITGLDYTAVNCVISRFTKRNSEAIDLLYCINALESGFLAVLGEYRKKQEGKK